MISSSASLLVGFRVGFRWSVRSFERVLHCCRRRDIVHTSEAAASSSSSSHLLTFLDALNLSCHFLFVAGAADADPAVWASLDALSSPPFTAAEGLS